MVKERIVGVAAVIGGIEFFLVQRIHARANLQPTRQIGIGDEEPSERDQIGMARERAFSCARLEKPLLAT